MSSLLSLPREVSGLEILGAPNGSDGCVRQQGHQGCGILRARGGHRRLPPNRRGVAVNVHWGVPRYALDESRPTTFNWASAQRTRRCHARCVRALCRRLHLHRQAGSCFPPLEPVRLRPATQLPNMLSCLPQSYHELPLQWRRTPPAARRPMEACADRRADHDRRFPVCRTTYNSASAAPLQNTAEIESDVAVGEA